MKDVAIEEAALDPPAPPNLNRGKLASLDEVVYGGKRNTEVLCRFFNSEQFRYDVVSCLFAAISWNCGVHFERSRNRGSQEVGGNDTLCENFH